MLSSCVNGAAQSEFFHLGNRLQAVLNDVLPDLTPHRGPNLSRSPVMNAIINAGLD